MEETHPRGEEGDHRGGLVHVGGKGGRCAGLVVVLQESAQAKLLRVLQEGEFTGRA